MSYSIRAVYWDCFFGDRTLEIEFWSMLAARYGSKILALMTATGEVAVGLAKRSFEVTGVDITPEMVSLAQKRSAGIPNIQFVQGDVTALQPGESDYDFAFIGTGDFHHFFTPKDQTNALTNIHQYLRAGGALALDLFPPPREDRPASKTSGTFEAFRPPEEPGVKLWKDSETRYLPETRRLHITQKMYVQRAGNIETFGYDFALQLFSRRELLGKLGGAGFRVTAEYGAYAMEMWEEGKKSWIVVAEKVS